MSNNTKHTPGPWRHNSAGPFTPVVRGMVRSELAILIDPDPGEHWSPVALILPSSRGSKAVALATARANARLIAAAPELLAACKEALAVLAYANTNGTTEALLSAAIAKAEGK